MQRLEVDAVVRRLEENRMYTTREIEPRKVRPCWLVGVPLHGTHTCAWWANLLLGACDQAWGSSNPSEQAKRRFTGAPRGTVGRASRPRGAGARRRAWPAPSRRASAAPPRARDEAGREINGSRGKT